MRSRKKELEELVALLEQPHDSVEDLADAAWKQLDTYRKDREAYVIVVNHGHPIYLSYGLYDTMNAATKDLTKFKSTTGNEKAYVIKVLSPAEIFNIDNNIYK